MRLIEGDLRNVRSELRRCTDDLERTRFDRQMLERNWAIRIARASLPLVRPLLGIARDAHRRIRGRARRARAMIAGEGSASRVEWTGLERRLDRALVASAVATGPMVSAIIVTRDGLHHLRRLLPALDEVAYAPLEAVVVDNGSTDGSLAYLTGVATRHPLRLIRNHDNRSFSDANNQGTDAAAGDYLLFLNNDVVPAGRGVLGHMVGRLERDSSIAAVGARLIYPRRTSRHPADSKRTDLSLQHRGIGFITEDGTPEPRNMGTGDDPLGTAASTPADVPAATAASLLVRRSAFESVGRFSGGYDYGMEDVDLCLKLRERGWRVVYEPQATFWHDESATQRQQASTARRTRQTRNRQLLQDRWGPRLFREIMLDRLSGGGRWSEATLHVALTVTRDDASAAFGDWYTAHELGDALATFGWRISYLERWQDHWYEPDSSIDVVIVLLDMMDIRRLPDGVVTVAWVRNWTDRWLSQPWFDEFDIVLASSERSKDLIDHASVHVAHVMPLATNPARFRTGVAPADPPVDVLFAGNRWGPPRRVEGVLHDLAARGWSVALFGTGWDQVPRVAALARGALPYDRLPGAYASAAVVVDDAGLSTRPYGSVNSRVFDALAVGAMVVSDEALGGRELFGDLLPVADTPAALVGIIEKQLRDPERQARAQRLQGVVLERHTYHHRALELREILRDWALARRIDLAIAPQSWGVAETWGDYHFARGLQRQFQRRGHPTRLRLRSNWESRPAARADVSLQLMGRGTRRVRAGQLSVLWIISHPDLVTDDIVLANDLVFAASDRFARRLAERTGLGVLPLHQATDPARFRPMSGGVVHELLFVANSRSQGRPVTDALDRTAHDFAVYGEHWKPGLVDPRHVRGHHIPNAALATYYSAATIVLNDHWPDMAAEGFLSNRLYDAAACGAFVISDHVEGIDTEFDGGIITFRDPDELREQVERFLQDPEARAANAERAYKAVLARHTFEDRVEQLLATIEPLAEIRPARLSTDGP